MTTDVQGTLRELLINAIENAGKTANGASDAVSGKSHAGVKVLAATAGAVAIAPIAMKGVGKLAHELGIDTLELIKSPENALDGLAGKLGDRVGAGIGDKVSQKVDESGGPSGILKDTVKDALPFGGGGGGTKGGGMGVGKGRRMPVQQSVDIGVPLETVYNQWTQLELWPDFMHRVTRVTQEDPCTVSFAVKVWGKTKEFTAQIETQRPDERIKWKVTQGMSHTGVVTFHELGPRLTRLLLYLDVEPGSLLEKAARGLRHVKRAARGDLHRFKAFIEMQESETGAWRGVIEDGELVEDHDPKYDKARQYGDPKATLGEPGDAQRAEDEDGDAPEEEEREEPRAERPPGGQRSASRARGTNGRSTSGGRRARATSASRASGGASGGSGQSRGARSGASPRSSGSSGGSVAKRGTGSRSARRSPVQSRSSASGSSRRSPDGRTRGR
jgi:uncharacterized protein YndB with AHSA1/START domain